MAAAAAAVRQRQRLRRESLLWSKRDQIILAC